jgi:heat shock protein HtpX
LAVISVILSITKADQFITTDGINLGSLLIFSAIVGFTGSMISLLLSKWIAISAYSVQIITTPANGTESMLMETVKQLSDRAGINMPEVGIYQANDINAFATGSSRNNSLLAVSSALLEKMDKDELEGVLGHEISHIANGDMVTLALVQGILNTFVIFLSRVIGYVVDKVVLKNDRDGAGIGYYLVSFVLQIVLGILASIIVMYFSRIREFEADAGSSHVTSKEKMIAALEKLKTVYERDSVIPDSHPEMATMKISHRSSRFSLFSTHPSLDDRIEALRKL